MTDFENLFIDLNNTARKYNSNYAFEFDATGGKVYFIISSCFNVVYPKNGTEYTLLLDVEAETIALETEALDDPIYNGDLDTINAFMTVLTIHKNTLFSLMKNSNLKPDKKKEKN